VPTVAWPRASTLVELLDLEELDRNLYRASNEGPEEGGRQRLFGGQVLAQSLAAAARTVPDGRFPHSCHGYFLRPGRPELPVILRVERDRDGRSFSARHVVALQDGDEIFTLSCSFHLLEESPEMAWPIPEGVTAPLEAGAGLLGWHSVVELRVAEPEPSPDGTLNGPPSRFWVRSRDPLPDDPTVHICALAYVSDIGSGFANVSTPGLPRGGPSIDHALWFHHPLRLDDWVLLNLWPVKSGGARGLYLGTAHDRAGELGALLAQEILLRPIE